LAVAKDDIALYGRDLVVGARYQHQDDEVVAE